MKIKLSFMLAGIAILAVATGTGGTGRAAEDGAAAGPAACTALATTQFAAVATLTTMPSDGW